MIGNISAIPDSCILGSPISNTLSAPVAFATVSVLPVKTSYDHCSPLDLEITLN